VKNSSDIMAILMPRKVKHRKWRKGRSKGLASRGTELAFGSFGLKSMGACWISARQIEAARRTVIRYLRRGGKLWIRIFPAKPVTRKGTEVPMGGGKGSVDHYVFPVKPGRIIFELEGVKEEIAREALGKAADKLSVKTRFVKK
jgi:large subunit ribosomal protein L16